MSQLWSIPPETTDWLLMKIQFYVITQLWHFQNLTVCPSEGEITKLFFTHLLGMMCYHILNKQTIP